MDTTLPPPPPHFRKVGFTLVEISVVLAIIGLIIGGTFVGKMMIEDAQIRQVVSQIQQLDRAFVTFKQKYNCLPGDCINPSSFGFTNNAAITFSSFTGNGSIDSVGTTGEPNTAFNQLEQANMIASAIMPLGIPYHVYDNAQAGSTGIYPPASNTPWWIYDFANWKPSYWSLVGVPSQGFSRHMIVLVGAVYGGWNNWAISAASTYAIDSKIDDKMPLSGSVRAVGDGLGTPQPGWWGSPCLKNGGYQYNINPTNPTSGDGLGCGLAVNASF